MKIVGPKSYSLDTSVKISKEKIEKSILSELPKIAMSPKKTV